MHHTNVPPIVAPDKRSAPPAAGQRPTRAAQLTKLRKCVAAGVCPCCTRAFQHLARHLRGWHPASVEAAE